MLVSIIIPVYNEAEGVELFHNKHLLVELSKLTSVTFEIIYINDGSRDTTLDVLGRIAKKDGRIKVVSLSRNFGKEVAITAGIDAAQGDATIIMDGDGQHPPSLLPEFIDKWKDGAQIVVGVRKSNKKEGTIKRLGSKVFYYLFNATSGVEIIPGSSDFRLIDKNVRKEFLRFSERHRITRGLIDWLGFKREYVYFHAPARIAGIATYSTGHLIQLALNSFVSLSLKPLFIFGWIGLIITSLSFTAGIIIFIEQIVISDPLHWNFTGSALLGIFISFLVGLVLVAQGITAIYLSHIHSQSQGRPLFVIDQTNSIRIKK